MPRIHAKCPEDLTHQSQGFLLRLSDKAHAFELTRILQGGAPRGGRNPARRARVVPHPGKGVCRVLGGPSQSPSAQADGTAPLLWMFKELARGTGADITFSLWDFHSLMCREESSPDWATVVDGKAVPGHIEHEAGKGHAGPVFIRNCDIPFLVIWGFILRY